MKRLVRLIIENSPRCLLSAGRVFIALCRSTIQRGIAYWGFVRFHDRYQNKILFIAGLPKSGTTWLANMLTSFPGFVRVTPLSSVLYEIKRKESHSYQLKNHFFSAYRRMLLVMKMHLNGTKQNAQVLSSESIKYVVLTRDLRDVAVSHGFYVSRTPWHPEYRIYRNLSPQERLVVFAETHLDAFAEWILIWKENRDRDLSIVVTYEDLRRNPVSVLSEISSHFGLDSSPDLISEIIKHYSMDEIAATEKNIPQIGSVVRKGKVGDWENHFTPDIKILYKKKIGQILIDLGYESGLDW